MVSTVIYRSEGNTTSYDANSITTGTQRGRDGVPKKDGTHHFVSSSSLKLLANQLVTYLRLMKDQDRWKNFEDRLEITFPRDIKIFHPLHGSSRILNPLTEGEVREFWEHINYYSEREEVRYEN